MITYELAKELKEAGFPIKYNLEAIVYDGEPPISLAVSPTLSELIEACKPVRILLTEENEGEWFSFSNTSVKAVGKTPEEAVARLYLELKKK